MDILVADDEDDIREQVCGILEDEGYVPRSASTIAEATQQVQSRLPALAIIDVWFKHCERDGLHLLEELRKRHADIPVIMISGHSTVDMAVRALKLGAYDFLTKPFALESLLNSVERALREARLSRENEDMAEKLGQQQDEYAWPSVAMQTVQKHFHEWAATDRRLLILGARGSGKTRMAEDIHQISKRCDRPLIRHNCADYPEDSEHAEVLFGSEGDTAGKLELAHTGTLILEKIEWLSPDMQQRITRFLQTQKFTRIGGEIPVSVNVRLLSTSSMTLDVLMNDHEVLNSLLDLLGVGVIALPPLRQRLEDFPMLVERCVKRFSASVGQPYYPLSAEAIEALTQHHWPNNIRELENVLARLQWGGEHIGHDEIRRAIGDEVSHQQQSKDQEWQKLIAGIGGGLRKAREEFESQYLQYHLERFHGNVSQTAQFVGMDRASLHRKLRSLDMVNHDNSEA